MALYQFYNADLVDIPKENKGKTAEAYIDNAIISAMAKTFEEAHMKIIEMMTRYGGAIEWAKKHNSHFEFSKLTLIDFAHSNQSVERPPLALPNIIINPFKSTKYLGIMLDQNLRWNEQLAYMQEKGSKWVAQIHRAAKPSWGLTPKAADRPYIGVALPRILYGIDMWCVPAHKEAEGDRRKGNIHAIKKLTTMQRAGTLAITSGFHTSPTDALDAHAAILPMHLKTGKVLHRAAVRLASLPTSHPLCQQYRLAGARKAKRHRSALQEILGMVVEAAGTRIFEERKDKAKKTMGKKEKRVQEITSLLTEEITEKLDTLRAEKWSFLQHQKACSELERIGRVLTAWKWTEGRERVVKKQAEIEKKEKEIVKTKKDRERFVWEGDAAEKDVEEVVKKRDEEMKKGGKFKRGEEEVAELEKVLVKIRTQVEIKKGTITDEAGRVGGLETS